MADEVVDVEPVEAGSCEPEVERYVQFIFDGKMVEFNVPWTQEQLQGLVTDVMADDGYIWVPQDEKKGTGAFINLNQCTNIKLLEREKAKPLSFDGQVTEPIPELPQAETPVDAGPDAAPQVQGEASYLDEIKERYGLPMFDGMFNQASTKFLCAMLRERFGIGEEEAMAALASWRETEA